MQDGGATVRDAMRFDGVWWRRVAERGAICLPEWFQRIGAPLTAAVVFAIASEQRGRVLRNQRHVRLSRSWWRERWDAYRVFGELAHSMTDGMKQWGPRPKPMDLKIRNPEVFEGALAEGRGLVVPTGHFGSWEIGARVLGRLGRPVNMVTAREPNPSVHAFVHEQRTRHDTKVIYSDRGYLSGLPILRALRRHEIVGMQIEPWGPLAGSHVVDFCGRPTRFQLGPFAIARVAGAPVVPVFALRTGIRRYELHIPGRFDVCTPADAVQALEETTRAYERLVRAHPEQWLMFEDVWPPPGGGNDRELSRGPAAPAARAPSSGDPPARHAASSSGPTAS